MRFWDKFPEVKAALKAQKRNDAAQPAAIVESQLLEFVDGLFKTDEPVLLAGNSIHQDRKFIDREWPKLAKRLLPYTRRKVHLRWCLTANTVKVR